MSGKHRRCPGNCGRIVRGFSCHECWTKLPNHLRRPILATTGKSGSRSKREAEAAGAAYLGKRTNR